jgi:2-polyprenyl-3-methyl-5-hydroxy-6-metoxy-1,4-benzoquinol methylase
MKITSRSINNNSQAPTEVGKDDRHYFDNVNPTILQFVQSDMLKICEFGCGGGALAAAIRKKNSDPIYYVGLELDDAAIVRAKPHLDLAIQCNLDFIPSWESNDIISQSLPNEYFDCIIFGDVLEHLREPENVLLQAVSKLKPGGAAIVCIPNVQHWTVFANLVSGSWPKMESGLFDRTHIRWFTYQDMVKLLEDAGLVIENAVGRVFDADNGKAVVAQLSGLTKLLNIDFSQFQERCLPLQYVLIGRKNL